MTTERQTAKDLSSLIYRIENQAVRSARDVTFKIRRRARRAVQTRNPAPIGTVIVNELQPTLRDLKVLAHLNGLRRSSLLKQSLKLASPFTSAIDALTKLTKADVNRLKKKYGEEAFEILNEVSADVNQRLRQTISELIAQGATVRTGITELNDTFNKLGLTAQNSFQLETIFRTQSQLAFNAGRWQADQDPDIQEILWGYRYVTVGDDRVRPEHAAMDDVTAPKDHPIWKTWWPPNGFNCRCQLIPVFEERKVRLPPNQLAGQKLQPDQGFRFNPGQAFSK